MKLDTALAKKLARALDDRGIDYSLVVDDSAIRNQIPSANPGQFGDGMAATLSVNEEDRGILEDLHAELFPVKAENEVAIGSQVSETGLLGRLKRLFKGKL